ncbi:Tetrapeptide transporter, OPT1/isp4 [Metarhizium album ARSEF 1941]|uniref:Tetrapeptide transporter, OPT1/isp4 n=1 Tax=Metarhizium album (strain ARSEF 1941) TaxID=1081103 RepID=A0A0B2X5C5_METAS|nr:Tetrapeptide transporter, OPT1/isp4 [Metarhizium album ARSEF 1941]KHO01579.1 Tetrapeptide transporter, OPT1/isp4 [Metarhizium album ARSEF 1941]
MENSSETREKQSQVLKKTEASETVEHSISEVEAERTRTIEGHLNATEDDILEAKELAASMTLEQVRSLMKNVLAIHNGDPNFPHVILQNIQEFMNNTDVMVHPEKHESLVQEMKLEAALITNNSPYAEVRAVTDNHDDPSMPVSTIRAWTIGILFSCLLAFVNQLFSIRQPPIRFDTNMAQLLAYPVGKAWEKWMPKKEMRIPFTSQAINLNPGRFNKKEHMLIAIMANTARSLPYTQYIVWTQVLPQYFNQQYARSFSYIFLNGFATNFIGYGLAGLTRKFLVYPSYCVWPRSLVTIALNTALHNEDNHPVQGPFGKIWNISRYRFFMIAFAAMFVYFWFPNYLFQVLTYFTWMTWIAPDNVHLNILTGMQNGLGLFNPLPTFDWNVINFNETDPLMIPSFSTFNFAGGMFITGLFILGVWYSNTWNTAYLPINSNRIYDHFGKLYNVSRTLDNRGMFDLEKYSKYSAPYMTAANSLVYGFFFAIYAAVITHVVLYHRYELKMGFKNLVKGLRWRRNKKEGETEQGNQRAADGEYLDIHNRLMSAYPEVSEWFYFLTLIISIVFGVLGIALWPTYTSPAVVLYGIWLCIMFVVPVGIVAAMTGIEVTLNVLAEFIGGMIVEGNALAMNFFKSYGYVTCAHALSFANDLKLAHYVKIPPRVTFSAQMIATLISTLICTGILKFQMEISGVCTLNPPMRFRCPGPNTFFTASVLWGTIGPIKVFGKNGQYRWLLLGFPLGVALVLVFYGLKKLWPNNRALRQVHLVAAIAGGLQWAPYSFSYSFPAVPVAWFSWIYIRGRYLDFWSKYNFVLSAALSAGIAISAIIMLFSVQWVGVEIEWWGNTQPSVGCEGKACTIKSLAPGERFYPWWDAGKVPAP